MPSPMETLLRIQLSPLPAQTIFVLVGSTASAPIDCTAGWSNTERKLLPPFTDFQTPPLAAPAKTVRRPLSAKAVTAATRPLMVAEPMLRAGSPEMVPASKRTDFGSGCCARDELAKRIWETDTAVRRRRYIPTLVLEVISKKSFRCCSLCCSCQYRRRH